MDLTSKQAEEAYHTHIAAPNDGLLRDAFIRAKERRNSFFPRGIQLLMESRAKKLGVSSTSSWRHLRGLAALPPRLISTVVLRSVNDPAFTLPHQKANLLVRHFLQVSRAQITNAPPIRQDCRGPLCGMDRPYTSYESDLAVYVAPLGTAPEPDGVMNDFLHHIGPVARNTLMVMINTSIASGVFPPQWKTGVKVPSPKTGKDPSRSDSYRPVALLSVLLKVAERMAHRRLSALFPHHQRQFGFTALRSTSDVIALLLDRVARGLNEFPMAEYERPRGSRKKSWLQSHLRGRYIWVRVDENTSRAQLTSAGVPQGSVLGPQLFLHYVGELLCRLDNVSLSAFMYADDLTLFTSGADIHDFASAMQPALDLITKWAAEYALNLNVAKSDAVLFYLSSHTASDAEEVCLRLGHERLHIELRPVKLLGATAGRLPNFGPPSP
ncbi:Reverse transcriptase domain [Trypanosoma melophagium]|uniref:Reverse transcriptase domain n=1 Tax=Trypanosoma melophagium TaxID=715481 RepID=UPI003519EBE9|nr:Reverse transcriptase domain [Trypanosoma melophagium]